MNNRKLRFIILMLAALLIIALPVLGLADAGNFSGDSDYGGSDYGGGDYSSWDSGSDYGGSGGFVGGFSLPVAVVVVVFIVFFVLKNYYSGAGSRQQSGQRQEYGRTANIEELKRQDTDFSEEEFLEQVGNTYLQIQDAWEAKQWEPMRAVMTDAMFNQFNRQLQEYINNKQTNHVDRISVLGSEITRYAQDDVNDILTVLLRTRIVDYVTDDQTGELIRGSKSKELFMTYEYTFLRRKGVKTQKKEQVSTVNCPNCGAPLSINQSGKCEYCGSVVSHGEYNWVISNIKGISQRSN